MSYALYRVKNAYADDPTADTEKILSGTEITRKYPWVRKFATEPDLGDGLFSLNLVSGLWNFSVLFEEMVR